MIICKGTEKLPHETIAVGSNPAGRCPLCWALAKLKTVCDGQTAMEAAWKERVHL